LAITAGRVVSEGTVDAWFERLDSRPTDFLNHQTNEITLSVPGTAESVITVAAVNSALPLVVHPRSSYGLTRDNRKKPELCAPGTAVIAAHSQTTNGVIDKSGTSMAAPHVTGAIALALSDRAKQLGKRWLTANQVRAALTQTTQDFDGFHSEAMGYGLLDVEAFFNRCRAIR
jgi:subtilisin family serine protease